MRAIWPTSHPPPGQRRAIPRHWVCSVQPALRIRLRSCPDLQPRQTHFVLQLRATPLSLNERLQLHRAPVAVAPAWLARARPRVRRPWGGRAEAARPCLPWLASSSSLRVVQEPWLGFKTLRWQWAAEAAAGSSTIVGAAKTCLRQATEVRGVHAPHSFSRSRPRKYVSPVKNTVL